MRLVANRVILSGTIYKDPVCTTSPSGTHHCRFILSHSSQQQEAGLKRKAWCHMPVRMSGFPSHYYQSNMLTAGCYVQVEGFISSCRCANGLSQLVLHAEKIELDSFI